MIGPLDYSLCNQTVTLYRKQGSQIVRQVEENCFYTWKQVQKEDASGTTRETECLLILPGENPAVFVGDRVYAGVGPQIDMEKWGDFLPVKVKGLAEINYVMPCYWEGVQCHLEAGRK